MYNIHVAPSRGEPFPRGVLPCMHIGYVPRERPPFSALNFRSGAYHFHKWHNILLRSITILLFFSVLETIIFTISLRSSHSPPPAVGFLQPARTQSVRTAPRGQRLAKEPARRVLQSVPETPTSEKKYNLYLRGLLFTYSHWLNLQHLKGFYIAVYGDFQGLFFDFRGLFFAFRGRNCPEPSCIFFSLAHFHARTRSGSPHFHALARSGAPHFSLCPGTYMYLPKFGVCSPPPGPFPNINLPFKWILRRF